MWRYSVENDNAGKPRWWLDNGTRTEAYSGESFYDHAGAVRAARHFKANAAAWNYVTFQGADGRWYWHARAANNANVAASGRGFATALEARSSADAVRVNGGNATGP